MLDVALKARIPMIGVTTDDPVNFPAVLQSIAQELPNPMTIAPMPATKLAQLGPHLYWTEDDNLITVENYKKLHGGEYQLVVLNLEKKNALVFEAGPLQVPRKMLVNYLKGMIPDENIDATVELIKGLSLKAASECVQITMARTGGVGLSDLRRTVMMLYGLSQGLAPMSTKVDFYFPHDEIDFWAAMNKEYFLDLDEDYRLVPRGLMLDGDPGVGKSMTAKVIANSWGVPLFRLDIPGMLNRWIGNSEANLGRALLQLEKDAPCVVLMDEMEKLFSSSNEGTMDRMLAQLLTFFQESQARILKILTTNNLALIPDELYRPGRLDMVVRLEKLNLKQSGIFIERLLTKLGVPSSEKLNADLLKALESHQPFAAMEGLQRFAHAELEQLVFSVLKQNKISLSKKTLLTNS